MTHEEYVSWLLYKGVDDEPSRQQQNFLTIALTKTLADAARERGLLERPAIQATLLVREAQMLKKALQKHVGEGAPWKKQRAELMAGVRYDLKRAQLVSTLNSQRVIEFPDGGGLELGEVRGWLKLRNAHLDPADLPTEQFSELAKELAFLARVRNRARELGLAETAEITAGLEWGEREILLVEETKNRLEERYRPPTEAEIRTRFEADFARQGTMTLEQARSQVQDTLRKETLRALQRELQDEMEAQLAVRLPNQETR